MVNLFLKLESSDKYNYLLKNIDCTTLIKNIFNKIYFYSKKIMSNIFESYSVSNFGTFYPNYIYTNDADTTDNGVLPEINPYGVFLGYPLGTAVYNYSLNGITTGAIGSATPSSYTNGGTSNSLPGGVYLNGLITNTDNDPSFSYSAITLVSLANNIDTFTIQSVSQGGGGGSSVSQAAQGNQQSNNTGSGPGPGGCGGYVGYVVINRTDSSTKAAIFSVYTQLYNDGINGKAGVIGTNDQQNIYGDIDNGTAGSYNNISIYYGQAETLNDPSELPLLVQFTVPYGQTTSTVSNNLGGQTSTQTGLIGYAGCYTDISTPDSVSVTVGEFTFLITFYPLSVSGAGGTMAGQDNGNYQYPTPSSNSDIYALGTAYINSSTLIYGVQGSGGLYLQNCFGTFNVIQAGGSGGDGGGYGSGGAETGYGGNGSGGAGSYTPNFDYGNGQNAILYGCGGGGTYANTYSDYKIQTVYDAGYGYPGAQFMFITTGSD